MGQVNWTKPSPGLEVCAILDRDFLLLIASIESIVHQIVLPHTIANSREVVLPRRRKECLAIAPDHSVNMYKC